MKIKKVVIPAAGYGTRFLPYTKAVPKEMLPLIDRPIIHHILEECITSQLSECIMITNKHKQAIANYCNPYAALEDYLQKNNKSHLLSPVEALIHNMSYTYIDQSEALGLGHALLTACSSIEKSEYFAVCLPDDLIVDAAPALQQLMHIAYKYQASVIAIQEVSEDALSSYGVISVGKEIENNLFELTHIVEKPSIQDAPSHLAVVGRYILSDTIFGILESLQIAHHELQLTAGINMLLQSERVVAYKIEGTRYDTGTPMGWIKAVIETALKHPEYSQEIHELICNYAYKTEPFFNM